MKIFITGNAASGKTTLSRLLARKTNIPSIGMDKFVWLPGWKRQTPNIIKQQLSQIVIQDNWIIEGVSSYVMQYAEVIIFLDVPIHIAYWRAFKRTCYHLFKPRSELPPHCPELKIIKELIKIIWTFHHKVKNDLVAKLEDYQATKKIYWIKNKTALNLFLNNTDFL